MLQIHRFRIPSEKFCKVHQSRILIPSTVLHRRFEGPEPTECADDIFVLMVGASFRPIQKFNAGCCMRPLDSSILSRSLHDFFYLGVLTESRLLQPRP